MSQSVKYTSSWPRAVIGAALRPHHLFAGMRYRMQGLKSTTARRLPTQVAQAIFSGELNDNGDFRNLSFTFAVIALSAKIACADGKLTREHYIAFRESFPLKGDMCGKIRSLFTLACRNETPAGHYVGQIRHMFPGGNALFVSLMERLFRIATASGELSREAERLLASIAHGFGIAAGDYHALCNSRRAQQVMGVSGRIKAGTLKKRYHELMKSYHPDRFSGLDLSPELQLLLQVKASEINAAYHALAR